MMKFFYLKPIFALTALLFFVSAGLLANDKLKLGVEQLQASVKNVMTEKIVYNQEFTNSGSLVYNLSFKQEEVDSKGKSTLSVYDFNLADIDENLISRLVSGKMMYVNLQAKNQQKLFKITENGENKGYCNEIRVYVNDVDEARLIMTNLKEIVPLASEMMKMRLNLTTYKEMTDWLASHIGNVSRAKSSVEQKLEPSASAAGKVTLQIIETDGGKMKSASYAFNLSDISPNLVFFDVKGADVVITMPTVRDNKLIKVTENGKSGTYDKEVQFYAVGIDEARDITTVLKSAIEKSLDVVAAAMPKLSSSPSAIIAEINTTIATVDLGGSQVAQSFTTDCVTELVLNTSTTKGSKEARFAFSFRDLNPSLIDFKVSRNVMEVTLQTMAGQKLIREIKDGQTDGYVDDIELVVNDPEDARNTVYRLKKLVELCTNNYKSVVPAGNMKVKTTWLTGAIGDVNMGDVIYNQVFTNPDGDDIRFEVTSSGAKSSSNEVFEFNLCDIDPNLIDFSISGKNLYVKLETKYKQKIIKSYKDGKSQNFTNEVLIRAYDIEVARNIIDALKGASATCK